MIRALEIIIQNTRIGVLREILAKAAGNIRNGMQISEAFTSPQIPYPKIYRASLLAGEKSGHLEQVLEKFNIYLGKISNLRRKMISGLTYPIILLLFMIAMVLVISIFVIPKFSDFFRRHGRPAAGRDPVLREPHRVHPRQHRALHRRSCCWPTPASACSSTSTPR